MSSTVDRPPAIDRRIAARRQTVREAGARRRLKWLLVLLGLAGGGALIAWLLYQSTLLAVAEITVDGQHRSNASAIVAAEGVATGMPTVNVPANELEAALLRDPWVAAVDVTVRWPGTVEVTVVEHVPSAWVQIGDAWALAARGGAVMEVAASIPGEAPRIAVGVIEAAPGDGLASVAALGALAFVDALPTDLVPGVAIEGDDRGLRAVVGGFTVDLGYPSEMVAKAAAVATLLETDDLATGSLISVVSPDRPAVLPPVPLDPAVTNGEEGAAADTAGAADDDGDSAAADGTGN